MPDRAKPKRLAGRTFREARIAMATTLHRREALGAWLAKVFRHWRETGRARYELAGLGAAETERIAHDLGLTSSQLQNITMHGPESADLLYRRLAEVGLDPMEILRNEPGVLRDLERTCALCDGRRECAHDLEERPDDPKWKTYCPNRETVETLLAEFAAAGRRAGKAG